MYSTTHRNVAEICKKCSSTVCLRLEEVKWRTNLHATLAAVLAEDRVRGGDFPENAKREKE